MFVTADSTTILLELSPSSDDNGDRIVAYELWIDEGNDLLSPFQKVLTYPVTGFQKNFILTIADNNLKPVGTIYRVKFRAKNLDQQYS